MKTRLHYIQRRIDKAIAAVRERGCPSLTRYLDRVRIYPFTLAKIRRKLVERSYQHELVQYVNDDTFLGACFSRSNIIAINVREHPTSLSLQKTIIHELTHYALRDYDAADEEFLACHAELEYEQCRRIYLTRRQQHPPP